MQIKSEDVYKVVQRIPKGKVVSYGQIARIVGIGPRQVGRILHNNPDNGLTPCHRVIHADGSLAGGYAFGGKDEQKKLLEDEGVEFVSGKVRKECFMAW